MILGRNTQQWLGLISATLAFLQLVVATLFPAYAGTTAIILGGLGGLLGVYIAFVANTYTTPANDPQIVKGTMIRVTDDTGRVIDHQKLTVTPPPAERPPSKRVMTHSGPVG